MSKYKYHLDHNNYGGKIMPKNFELPPGVYVCDSKPDKQLICASTDEIGDFLTTKKKTINP